MGGKSYQMSITTMTMIRNGVMTQQSCEQSDAHDVFFPSGFFVKQQPVWKSKFYGAFVLNRRANFHAIDATPARWRGDAGSSPLDGARTAASSRDAPDSLVDLCTGVAPSAIARARLLATGKN